MLNKPSSILFCVCLLTTSPAYTEEPIDICGGYKPSTDITVEFLSHVEYKDDGLDAHLGKFLIENHESKSITIIGRNLNGYFYVFPNAVIQFGEKDGDWLPPMIIPADSLLPVKNLEIKANSSGIFYAFTPSYSGPTPIDRARMVLVNDPRNMCVYSEPFPSVNAKP